MKAGMYVYCRSSQTEVWVRHSMYVSLVVPVLLQDAKMVRTH